MGKGLLKKEEMDDTIHRIYVYEKS